MISRLIFTLCLLIINLGPTCYGQTASTDNEMSLFLDSLFHKGVSEGYIPGGVIGIFQGDQFIHQKAYGLANIENKLKASHDSTLFQMGSVGKLLTAIAVLQMVEQDRLELDENVNHYLSSFEIETPTDRPLTLRDLLTHSGGLNERVVGYASRDQAQIEALGDHLKKRMPRLYTEPGTEISYSNYGYGLAGYLVELQSGIPFKEYIQKNIFDKLEMTTATYNSNLQSPGLAYAIGYELNDGFDSKELVHRHVTPAGSLVASGADLAKLIKAITQESKSLLSTDSYKLLKTQQFTDKPMLTGYSLGMEVQNFNGHYGIGKGGNIPGFLSYVLFFPESDLAIYIALNTETDNFLQSFTESFINQFFEQKGSYLPASVSDIDLSAYTGEYRANRYNRYSIEDVFENIAYNFTMYQQGDSVLMCYHSGAWQYYQPITPLQFQNTKNPNLYFYFERSPGGRVQKFYRNFELGGFYIPAGYEKLPWYDTIYFINEYAAYLPLMTCTFLLFPIWWGLAWLIRLKKKDRFTKRAFSLQTKLVAFIFSLLIVIQIVEVLIKLFKLGSDLFFGIPESIVFLQNFSFLIPALLLLVIYRAFKVWKDKEGFLINRFYFSLYTLAGMAYTLLLWRWHFIGVNF